MHTKPSNIVAVGAGARQDDTPCPYSRTDGYAAVDGHLEVLQWLRESDATGEVWDEAYVRHYADGSRKQEVLTWLDQLSAPLRAAYVLEQHVLNDNDIAVWVPHEETNMYMMTHTTTTTSCRLTTSCT